MSLSKQQIINTAKSYIGTPYHHQGRVKGVGIDCCGLVICVTRELNLSEFDIDGYSRTGDGVEFLEVFRSQLPEVPINEIEPGDVACFKILGSSHCGIVSILDGEVSLIHAYGDLKMVKEHRLDEVWRDKIVAGFRLCPL